MRTKRRTERSSSSARSSESETSSRRAAVAEREERDAEEARERTSTMECGDVDETEQRIRRGPRLEGLDVGVHDAVE